MNDSYTKSLAFLEEANEAISVKKNTEALTLIDKAILEIGDQYLTKDTVDDTPLKLTLAQVKQSQGDIEQAINIKKSVLMSRLDLYKKITCEKNSR